MPATPAAVVPALAATQDRIALRDPVFISDLHLSAAGPRTLARFERFAAEVARAHAELVILGDLFEYWAGDDGIDDATGGGHDDAWPDDRAVARRTIAALHDVAARGVAVYLMHGNRDLLLGSAFATAAGATLLADPALADLAGRPVLLVHGDTWCTRDVDYLRFRGLVRDPQWQRDFLARPLAARRAFIGQARAQSEAGKRTKAMALMDVTPDAVVDALRAAGVTLAIHGHTHRPAKHRLSVDGRAAERHVLPDWDYDAPTPRGGYLALQDGVLSAVRLAP